MHACWSCKEWYAKAPLVNATAGTELVIIEGMGRAIHTNHKSVLLASVSCPERVLDLGKTSKPK